VKNWKVLSCVAVAAISALCPAPIRVQGDKSHCLPYQSPAQRAEDQRFNGTMGVVGTVPVRTNADGTGPAPVENNPMAAATLAHSGPEAQATAIKNLTRAQHELKLDHQGAEVNPMVVLIVVLVVVGGGLYGAKTWLDTHGPAPKTFNPAERLRKPL
jgi:hypothetical protein